MSGFLDVIAEKLQKRAEGRIRHSPGVFHPSELGGCTRALFYSFTGATGKSKETPQGAMILWHGETIHSMLQELLKSIYGDRFQAEVACKTDDPIEGHCDGVIVLNSKHVSGPKKGEPIRFGVEIKSTKQSKFKKWKKEPDPAHRIQAMAYMVALKLDFMHIVYYNKNDEIEDTADPMLQMKEFKIEFDQGVWTMVQNKMATVKEAAQRESPPPQEISPLCHWCKYFHICKPEV
jgi:CRISPR/Cas system-associated exonuclease Cas4 (RecB family)